MQHESAPVPDWAKDFPAAVTVSAADGTILYMNEKAVRTFASYGGAALIGKNLAACHRERSVGIMERILATGEPNSYTIEKEGKRKLLYQAPWYADGKAAGLVEISIELPAELPHYVRG